MESKHAGDPYACRAEIRPPLSPAAEIKDLLLDGPQMIYIRDPVATNILSYTKNKPPPNKLAGMNCSSLNGHVGRSVSIPKYLRLRWAGRLLTFACERLFVPWFRLLLGRNQRITFQVTIPFLSCDGKERRQVTKKKNQGRFAVKNGRRDQLATSSYRSAFSYGWLAAALGKKNVQSGGRIKWCKAQLLDLLFSCKLSISPFISSLSAYIFSFSQPFLSSLLTTSVFGSRWGNI